MNLLFVVSIIMIWSFIISVKTIGVCCIIKTTLEDDLRAFLRITTR